MECKYCGEEMEEIELVDLGYGQRFVEFECPNNCEFIEWFENNNKESK